MQSWLCEIRIHPIPRYRVKGETAPHSAPGSVRGWMLTLYVIQGAYDTSSIQESVDIGPELCRVDRR